MVINEAMKRIFLVTIAILAIFTSCQESDVDTIIADNDIIYASIEDGGLTKTVLDIYNNIRWTEGDQIAAFMKSSTRLKYQVSSSCVDMTSASFEAVGNAGGSYSGSSLNHNVVYYPYADDVGVDKLGDNYLIDVSLPAIQYYASDSFGKGAFPMVAVSEDNNFVFKNICGGVKLQMKGTQRIASIMLQGNSSEKIAGEAVVVVYPDNSAPTAKMAMGATTSITLNCGTDGVQLNENGAMEFILTMPPVVFDKGFTVNITDTDGNVYTVDTDKANTVLRSTLLVMPAFTLGEPLPGNETDVINGTVIGEGNNLVGWVSDVNTRKGIPGVAVSDGFTVVKTDANGVYQIKGNTNAKSVFISVPAEYEVPLSENNTPLFYSLDVATATVNRNDFILTPLTKNEENFTLVAIGDPQVKSAAHIERYKNETLKDIKSTLTKHQSEGKYLNAYAVTLGDIVYDKPNLWESVLPTMHNVRLGSGEYLPIFQCIGNHDHNAKESTDRDAVGDFINYCGPTDYSFNRGKVHIVVMDDVICTTTSGSTWSYESGLSQDQWLWLNQDLAAVEDKEDKMVIICCHIPFRSGWSSKSDVTISQVLNLMKEFNEAHIMIGHTHYAQNYLHTQYKTKNGLSIYEHIHGGACGSWWTCNVNVDGSPNGYSLYEIEGHHMKNWIAKGTNLPEEHQMMVYNGSQTYTGSKGYVYNWYKDSVGGSSNIAYKGFSPLKGCFVVNLWNDDEANWEVEFTYNGETTPMTRVSSAVMNAAAMSYFFNELGKNTKSWAKALNHYWYIPAPGGLDPSEITGWSVTATQTIPGSGEKNVYTTNTLQVDNSGF